MPSSRTAGTKGHHLCRDGWEINGTRIVRNLEEETGCFLLGIESKVGIV